MVFKIPEAYAAQSTVFDACLSIDCEDIRNQLTFCDVLNALYRSQQDQLKASVFTFFCSPQFSTLFDVLADKNETGQGSPIQVSAVTL